MNLRVGDSTPSIHHAGERIATQPFLPSYVKNAYSADELHMPDASFKPEWDDARIRGRARETGPSCAEAVGRIFARVKIREQAYNPALSVLRLSKKYGVERLEAACAHALPRLTSPRYRHLKAILDSSLDEVPSPASAEQGSARPSGHVRGADHYRNLG